jgi:[ribosomal protein S5]-alanine N-acetyltransferase
VLGVDVGAIGCLRVIQADPVVELDRKKWAELLGIREPEQFGEEAGRFFSIFGGDDGVVERDCHFIQSTSCGGEVPVIDDDVVLGARVRLRAPRIDDAEQLFERVASDPEVTRYLSWTPHPDVDETRRVITELFNVGDERTWLIELRESGEAIGLCGWRRPQRHAAELGYCLARLWWGQHLMAEVVSLLLNELRADPAVYRAWAVCHVDNGASARVLQRCGLTLEGRLARYGMFPNVSSEPQDVLLFAAALR